MAEASHESKAIVVITLLIFSCKLEFLKMIIDIKIYEHLPFNIISL